MALYVQFYLQYNSRDMNEEMWYLILYLCRVVVFSTCKKSRVLVCFSGCVAAFPGEALTFSMEDSSEPKLNETRIIFILETRQGER